LSFTDHKSCPEEKKPLRTPEYWLKVFSTFGQKKKVDNKVGVSGTTPDTIKSEPRDSADRSPPRYFAKRMEENHIKLTEVLSRLIRRLENMNKERSDLLNEVETLREDAGEEVRKQEKDLSTFKEQVISLREVLEEMRSRRRT
jgi:predicted RNase H-like nuclease (RuvC/YqgF family)